MHDHRAGSRINRRSFLARTAFAGGLAVAVPFEALLAREGRRRDDSPDYGPLAPAIDETTGLPLLMLPAGFRYVSFGWRGDPMENGLPTPGAHDGMAAFRTSHHHVRIVRNHEVGPGLAFAPDHAYDQAAGGGTVTLEFDTKHGQLVSSEPSLGGTIRNCAGGLTPWGSWLTCEETMEEPRPGSTLLRKHGYIFDVPADSPSDALALPAMGRFSHEAVAVDPHTGYVYETEDAGNNSGFYRFRPNRRSHLLKGGVLEILGIDGQPQFDTRTGQTGEWLSAVWYEIPTPDPDVLSGEATVFAQGFAEGGARFGRLEGAWYGDGRIYFVSTSGGNAAQGQIFEYDPKRDRLRLLFESPSAEVLNAPDNICVSPRGGLVLCEDGSGAEYVHGLTTDGIIFRFAQNNVVLNGERNGIIGDFRGSEFAGACYSPDGDWLFFNVQSPGISFAVTGPWKTGAL